MPRALVMLALLWPLAMAAAVAGRAEGAADNGTAIVYSVGALICHQRPERSFHTAGVPWPVCARCTGLYVGAMAGALFAAPFGGRRWTRQRNARVMLIVAGAPTALAWGLEWAGAVGVTNALRAAASLPLGSVIAALLVTVASPASKVNPVN